MKNLLPLFYLICFVGINTSVSAQDSSEALDESVPNFLERHPLYDFTDELTSVDTIPGFDSTSQKLKVSGIVYKNDGITPAKDVIVYIEQPDENGDFDLRKENDKRYVHNRGWVKTDADGQYTFYTYVPGGDRFYNQMQQLFPAVKAPSEEAYDIPSFLFDDDPLLTKRCRRRITKKDDPSRIMKLTKQDDGMFVAKRDIILASGLETSK